MKKRSIAAVILLPFVTFGIYVLYWFVKTKGELNEKGANIPTAWLLIIPFVNIWWIWKYYEGVDHVTDGKISGVLMFILDLFVTSLIPMAICQDTYNKLSDTAAVGIAPIAPASAPPTSDMPAAPTAPVNPEAAAEPVPESSESSLPTSEAVDTAQNSETEGDNTPPINPVV